MKKKLSLVLNGGIFLFVECGIVSQIWKLFHGSTIENFCELDDYDFHVEKAQNRVDLVQNSKFSVQVSSIMNSIKVFGDDSYFRPFSQPKNHPIFEKRHFCVQKLSLILWNLNYKCLFSVFIKKSFFFLLYLILVFWETQIWF